MASITSSARSRRAGTLDVAFVDVVILRAIVTKEALDDALSPEKMTSPRRVAAAEPKLD